jgi:hypothetical protein
MGHGSSGRASALSLNSHANKKLMYKGLQQVLWGHIFSFLLGILLEVATFSYGEPLILIC